MAGRLGAYVPAASQVANGNLGAEQVGTAPSGGGGGGGSSGSALNRLFPTEASLRSFPKDAIRSYPRA